MDDTLWLAKSRENLTEIMKVADSFYDLNFIKVNWDKSVLLTNKNHLCQPITLPSINGTTTIHPLPTNDSIRYLGVWISLGSNKTFISKSLINEIKSAVAIMTPKRLTDKQIVYIYNSVLIPRIEYRSQLNFFTEQQCKLITTPFIAFMKKKLKLSCDTPSSIIYSHSFYNLTDLYQRLFTAYSEALLYMMNDTGLLGNTIRICVQLL